MRVHASPKWCDSSPTSAPPAEAYLKVAAVGFPCDCASFRRHSPLLRDNQYVLISSEISVIHYGAKAILVPVCSLTHENLRSLSTSGSLILPSLKFAASQVLCLAALSAIFDVLLFCPLEGSRLAFFFILVQNVVQGRARESREPLPVCVDSAMQGTMANMPLSFIASEELIKSGSSCVFAVVLFAWLHKFSCCISPV